MKKTYISPLAVEVSVEAASMLLANSIQTFSDKTVDTSDPSAQLGGERRGEWGNLWK